VASSERVGLGSRGKQSQGKEYAFWEAKEQVKQAFPVSNQAIIASAIFWFFLVFLTYFFGGYAFMWARVAMDDTDLEEVS
jgi:hypothetical protein